jgi:hypothetical protein
MSQRVEKMLQERARRRRLAESQIEELPLELDRATNLDKTITAAKSPDPRALSPGAVIQLQRTIGNRAVQELLDEPAAERDGPVLHPPLSTVSTHPEPVFRSPALQLRHQMQRAPNAPMLLQRAVKTWAGEWDTDKYNIIKDGSGTEIGVDIELRFTPGKHVDAKSIGTLQMVNSMDKGKVIALNKTVKSRSIGKGKAGEGSHIDQLAKFANPMYATGKTGKGDTLASTKTHATWGQHGYHYKDKAGKVKKKDALLKDGPQLPGRGANASQIFETSALALEGTQKGTYYGSVKWGWQTDGTGTFTKLPLSLISSDVPTDTFAAASELWNKGKTSKGAETINLPIVKGKFANTEGVWLVTNPSQYKKTRTDKLPKNTRVEVIDKGKSEKFNKVTDPKYIWWKVTVVDGTAIGKVGWVMQHFLSDAKTMEKREPGWFSRVLGFIGSLFGG